MSLGEQLASLFLQAVPTIVLVFLFYLFLRASLFTPLERVMAERSARIEGARRESEAGQSAAVEKEKQYQEALRKARTGVYAEQEQLRRAVLDERAALMREARNAAGERIRKAKDQIATEMVAARKEIEGQSDSLAAAIVHAVLERRPPAAPAPRGTR